MPGTTPPTRLISTTAMIVLLWSRATRDLLKSFGWGIAALHRLDAATKLPRPRRPPHRISWFRDAILTPQPCEMLSRRRAQPSKVGKSDGKGTFAGTRGNDKVAPFAAD